MTNKQPEKLSITALKEQLVLLEKEQPDKLPILLKQLRADPRQGVHKLSASFQKRYEKRCEKQAAFKQRLELEKKAWSAGYPLVAGIDEVGRGPLAGPVVAAAVILPHDFHLYEVNDSKQLSAKKRTLLAPLIKEQALAVSIGLADNHVIDEINIYEATRQAMSMAVANLKIKPDQLLIDAMSIETTISQQKLIKGDARSISIGAASIIAKTTRDEMMAEYASQYPGYAFEKNAGYGTAEHLFGIEKYGITPLHRQSFEPIKSYLKK